MFTVKHIDAQGNETLFNAASVRVIRGTEGEDGVKIEGVVDQDFTGVHYGFIPPSEPRVGNGYDPAVFVMNENGATVANYRL